jgi:hypothetical protein
MTRKTYDNGRLIPVPGDKVFKNVRAAFGGQGTLIGEVYLSKGELRIKDINAYTYLSGGKSTGQVFRTQKLTPSWTVEGDPELKLRENAREQKACNEKKANEAYKARLAEANDILEREGTRLDSWGDVKPGDIVAQITGTFFDGKAYPFNRIEFKITMIKDEYPEWTVKYGDKFYALGKQIMPEVEPGRSDVTMGHAHNWVKLNR